MCQDKEMRSRFEQLSFRHLPGKIFYKGERVGSREASVIAVVQNGIESKSDFFGQKLMIAVV